jgi:hypothetical protein
MNRPVRYASVLLHNMSVLATTHGLANLFHR